MESGRVFSNFEYLTYFKESPTCLYLQDAPTHVRLAGMKVRSDMVVVLSGTPLGNIGQMLLERRVGDRRIQKVDSTELVRLEGVEVAPAVLLIQSTPEPTALRDLLRVCRAHWPNALMFLFDEQGAGAATLETFFNEGGHAVLTEAILASDVWPVFVDAQIKGQAERADQLNLLGELARYKTDQDQGAATLHRLVPSVPLETDYCRLSHQITPSLAMSGDFIDYQTLDADRVLFCLADVSGHGASSALVTVVLKTYLRQAVERIKRGEFIQLPELMSGLNRAICDSALDHHVTCVLGLIEGSNGLFNYISAGHFPHPMLIQNGEISLLESGHLPLGLLISSGYDAHQLTLVPDFRLVIVTDGVLEGLGNKTLAEREAQLLSFVERDAGEAQGWLNRFLGDSDESLTDDASVLCVTGLRSR